MKTTVDQAQTQAQIDRMGKKRSELENTDPPGAGAPPAGPHGRAGAPMVQRVALAGGAMLGAERIGDAQTDAIERARDVALQLLGAAQSHQTT